MTKIQLEEELKQANELIEKYKSNALMQELNNAIADLLQKNKALMDDKNSINEKEYNNLAKELQRSQKACKTLDDLLEMRIKENEKLKDIIQKQQQEIEELKKIKINNTNNKEVKIKNERNAGRKKTANVDLIQKLRSEGKTQEQVSKELNISISTVRRNE